MMTVAGQRTSCSAAEVCEAGRVLLRLNYTNKLPSPRILKVSFRDVDGGTGRRDAATHWLHPYPAKMFHRIPQAILAALRDHRKLTVLDPFCGSGTVLLESILSGHDAIGIDVNPLARLITAAKTFPIDPEHLRSHFTGIRRRAQREISFDSHPVLDYWFRPEIRYALQQLFAAVNSIRHEHCKRFYLVTLSSIVRKCSLADPSIPPPVRLRPERTFRASERYKRALTRALELKASDVFCLFQEAAAKNLNRMAQLFAQPGLGSARMIGETYEASRTSLRRQSVDLVVTSPPYCGAQKYVRSTRLEMLLMDIDKRIIDDADRRTLGTERLVSRGSELNSCCSNAVHRMVEEVRHRNSTRAEMLTIYINYLYEFAAELQRVLRPGGNAFVTFGTDRIAGMNVDCAQIFADASRQYALTHVATLVDSIPSRGLMTDRHHTAATIKDERVVWLRAR